jgi:hypothetical protein
MLANASPSTPTARRYRQTAAYLAFAAAAGRGDFVAALTECPFSYTSQQHTRDGRPVFRFIIERQGQPSVSAEATTAIGALRGVVATLDAMARAA